MPYSRRNLAELYREQWWVRCLLSSEHDLLGLILRAAMGLPTENPPWLGPSAIIDEKGIVLSNFVGTDNKMRFAAVVCTLDDLLDNLRRLAEAENLTDWQAIELFRKVREWIKADARPETEQPDDRVPIEWRRTQ